MIVPTSGVFLPRGCAKVRVADAAGAQKCRRFIREYYQEDKLGVCGGERMKLRRPRQVFLGSMHEPRDARFVHRMRSNPLTATRSHEVSLKHKVHRHDPAGRGWRLYSRMPFHPRVFKPRDD